MDINNLWSEYDLNLKKQNSRCLAVNTILEGKYLVGPVLGQGGFGITYVGYDLNMETKIAIKEYFPVELVSRDTTTAHGDRVLSLSGEKSVTYKQGLKKYVAEAQNVSQFSEIPGVVSVKDFFYANETAYIVMEFIDGISLKDYLKEQGGRLSEEETLKIMRPILDALVQVHKSGIIHRDISPDNIMLTFLGENDKSAAIAGTGNRKIKSVKLIDFGAARMTAKNDQKSLTIILKHGYAPEEQYRTHGEQGSWTDVYALCAVLYRMLTGETPVPAMDRMFKDELKTLEQCGAKVSVNTSAAILKGLAVKKDDRIQNVQALINALYNGAKIQGSGATKSKNKAVMIGGGALAVLAAGCLAIGILGSGNAQKKTVGAADHTISTESVSNQVGAVTDGTEAKKEAVGIEPEVSFNEEDELGEQIAFYHPQNSIAADRFGKYLLICKPDGTVEAKGYATDGEIDVQDWEHIVSVQSGDFHSLGLRSDGKVVATGDNDLGQCEVDSWTDVVQISAGYRLSLGVTKDGQVLAVGKPSGIDLQEFAKWTDIKDIAIRKSAHSVDGIAGLKYDGTIVLLPKEDSAWDTTIEISGWEDVVEIFFWNDEIYGINADGMCRSVSLDPWDEGFEYEDLYADEYRQKNGFNPPMKYLEHGFQGVTAEGVYKEDSFGRENPMLEKVRQWENLISVGAVGNTYYGLQEDGNILSYVIHLGNAELNEFKNLEWADCIDEAGVLGRTKDGEWLYYDLNGSISYIWDQLTQMDQKLVDIVSVGDGYFLFEDGSIRRYDALAEAGESGIKQVGYCDGDLFGLSEDGKIVSIFGEEVPADIASWENLVQIGANRYRINGGIYGLQEDGTVISTEENFKEISNVKQIAVSNGMALALTNDGNVVELSDTLRLAYQEAGIYMNWSSFTDLVQIDVGEAHAVGLKSDGTVVVEGINTNGQCNVDDWKDIVYLEADGEFTLGITKDGELKIACDYLTK